jgi:hypothetical protein
MMGSLRPHPWAATLTATHRDREGRTVLDEDQTIRVSVAEHAHTYENRLYRWVSDPCRPSGYSRVPDEWKTSSPLVK